MVWLQENWIIAVVGLVVAVVLLWWLFGRKKAEEIAPPTFEPAKPAKPLEPVKPEIIAAEPARFKPREPVASPTPPAAEPVAKSAPPPPAAAPAPKAETAPAPKAPPKPVKPAAKAPKKPAAAPPSPEPVSEAAPPAPAPEPVPAPESVPAAAAPVADEPPPPAPEPAPAPAAKTENLQLLKGVGPKLVALLNGLGVTSFAQIAAWTDADIAAIDPQLGAFQGRIARDNLVDQAGYLARGDKPGFEAKYGALGGEL